MRMGRIKLKEAATYHVMSRVIEHRFIFGDTEKSFLHNLMRRLEDFTGCELEPEVNLYRIRIESRWLEEP